MSTIPGPLSAGTAAFPHGPGVSTAHGDLCYANIVYSCDPGYRPLFLDLRVPQRGDGPYPLIIWVHGGGWVHGSRRRLSPNLFDNRPHEQMLDAGFAVASIDYRLAREAGFEGMLLDVKAAIRWLRAHSTEFDIDPNRVIVWGESAGGHIAAMAGMCTKLDGAPRTGEYFEQSEIPAAVVDWYGPADMQAMADVDMTKDADESGEYDESPVVVLQRSGTWSYAELSPTTYVRAGVPPMFIAQGTEDQAVLVGQNRTLAAELERVGATVEYLEVPGAGHVWRGAPSVPDIVEQGLIFLRKVL